MNPHEIIYKEMLEQATTKYLSYGIRGKSANIVILDEFASIDPAKFEGLQNKKTKWELPIACDKCFE